MTRVLRFSLVATIVVLITNGTVVRSEEVEKKFRIGLAAGGYDTRTAVRSDSANTLLIVNSEDDIVNFIDDPRNDLGAIGELRIEPSPRITADISYAFTRIFVLEGSIGYQKSDLRDIEVQAQFTGQVLPEDRDFDFGIYPVNGGSVTEIPVQITAIGRYRPKASLHPYLGIGVGYMFVGYEPGSEMNDLSRNLDNSVGGFSQLASFFGSGILVEPTSVGDLSGAHVDAPDTFEWHAVGGIEYEFHRKWSAFLDFRYIFASRSLSVGFNGSESLGVSVPNTIVDESDPLANTSYGAFRITQGGLIDAGHLEPQPGETTDCNALPAECRFVPGADGVLDTGAYYVKGGAIKYGGASLQVGIRYTF